MPRARYAKNKTFLHMVSAHLNTYFFFWEMFCVRSAKTHYYVCEKTRCRREYLCMSLTYSIGCVLDLAL